MKAKKFYTAPDMEVLHLQAESMCNESVIIPVSDNPINEDDGLERAIKGGSFFDTDNFLGLPQF